ncbi:MAG: twin-arginine translocase TatA/TatE family subunit [Planctomycetota bacterium]
MFGLGTMELVVILVILVLLFGANKIPALARSLGSSVNEFKKGMRESDRDENRDSKPVRPRPAGTGLGNLSST